MKYIYALACTLIFIILLISIYLIHINYFGVDVVLYSALVDAAIALVLAASGNHPCRMSLFMNIYRSFDWLTCV